MATRLWAHEATIIIVFSMNNIVNMKATPLLIACILLFFKGYCQGKSRVIFYYKPLINVQQYFGKGLIPVYFNPANSDTTIKIKKTFVWETDNPTGKYSFVTTGDHPALETNLNAPNNSISFIEMKQRFLWPMPKLRKRSYVDFRKVYDKQKKYRKRLADAGFNSVEELVNGYTVN